MKTWMRTHIMVAGLLTAMGASCGTATEDLPREEVVDSLRVLGIKFTKPVVEIASDDAADTYAEATVYAVTPNDRDVAIEAWVPTTAQGGGLTAAPSDVDLASSTMVREKKGALYLHSVALKIKVPKTEAWAKHPEKGGRLTYGVKLKSDGITREVQAQLLAYPSGSSQLGWTAPTFTVSNPTSGAQLTAGDAATLAITATSAQNEPIILGWFVSSGQVSSRKSASTSWYPSDTGAATLIATVRGRQSLTFDFQVIEVEVE